MQKSNLFVRLYKREVYLFLLTLIEFVISYSKFGNLFLIKNNSTLFILKLQIFPALKATIFGDLTGINCFERLTILNVLINSVP